MATNAGQLEKDGVHDGTHMNRFEHSTTNADAIRQAAIQSGNLGLAPGIRVIGNPGPLGLFSFASTTLILSLYNAGARDITHPNVVVGMALACGGLAQLLAGQWEFVAGNTFGATAFTSYGAFWISFALIFIPGSGIGAAYADAGELHNALGIYLITWMVVTFLFFIAVLRTHAAFLALFSFLTITFLLLAVGEFTGSTASAKAGGIMGILTALIAYYTGASMLINTDNSFFTIPLLHMKRRN